MVSWRIHRAIVYCVLGLIAAGLLGIFGIKLDETALFIPWKYVLLLGTGYVMWAFYKMLHF